jgi:Lon protease-like protein
MDTGGRCHLCLCPRIMSGVMKIPLFPLDVVLFPGAALPLHIFEERYKSMISSCLESKEPFGVVRATSDGLAVIGCLASIVTVLQRYSDGRLDILCEGVDRFEIEALDNSRAYLQAEIDSFADQGFMASRADREKCLALHLEVTELAGTEEAMPLHVDLNQPISLLLSWLLPVDLDFKQELLSYRSDAERTTRLLEFYDAVLPKLRLGAQTSRAAVRNGHVM